MSRRSRANCFLHNLHMADLTVRRAEARDSEELAECIEDAYSVYSSRIDDLPAVSDGIADAIQRYRVWVAETERIVGVLILVPQEDSLVLENIAVRPECTGMGHGRALMLQAEKNCQELGLHEIRLSTHKDMPENVAIYSRLGWRETGRSGNKVHMSKTV